MKAIKGNKPQMINVIGIAVPIQPGVPLNTQPESSNSQPNPIIKEMMAQNVKHENPMKPNMVSMRFFSDVFSSFSIL